MKGIAHFASGLCVASFVPGVTQAAANGDLSIALGGACAMLPDFLDFRFARFLEKPDAEIVPDLKHPDPQILADAVAAQLRAVAKDGRPRIVHLHPVRRSLIDWTLYIVSPPRFVRLSRSASSSNATLSAAYGGRERDR